MRTEIVRLVGPWLLSLSLLAVAGPARSSAHVDDLLLSATSVPELRALLRHHVETAPDSLERGEALYYLGMSYDRVGLADSAILAYEGAVAARNDDADRKALMDALLRRRAPQDPERVLQILAKPARDVIGEPARDVAEWNGRRAWALYLAGNGDSAVKVIRSAQYWLLQPLNPLQREWRYRLGVLEQDNGDVQRAVQILALLAVESRFQDMDVMADLHDATKRASNTQSVEVAMRQERKDIDEAEMVVLKSLGARRVAFKAQDGAQLSGIVFGARGARRSRAIVALVPPDTPVESFDSLAVGLRRAGYALMLMDVRGGGSSVDRATPLPETWRGREVAMQSAVARDVVPALRALAAAASVDTTRYLLVGIGPTAPIAVEAAGLDRRAALMMLISPEAAPPDQGMTRSRLSRLKRPVFFQIPSLDNAATMPFVDALYRSTDQRTSRISDSDLAGYGPQSFRMDRTALPRLTRWLNESWAPPARTAPRR